MKLWERIQRAIGLSRKKAEPDGEIKPAEKRYDFVRAPGPRIFITPEPVFWPITFEEGIEDLYKLCETAEQEGAYAFSPDKCAWINLTEGFVSGNLLKGNPELGMGTNNRFIVYANFGNHVYNVHIHPEAATRKAEKELDEIAQREGLFEEERKTFNKRTCRAVTIIPSVRDIGYYLTMREFQPIPCRHTNLIVSKHGLTNINLLEGNPQEIYDDFVRAHELMQMCIAVELLEKPQDIPFERVVSIINSQSRYVSAGFKERKNGPAVILKKK